MKVTAWKGGSYGLKIKIEDRDNFFQRNWKYVNLKLPNDLDAFAVNVDKKSFWNKTCHELIHKNIGAWLKDSGLAPWKKGHPPKFEMICDGANNFRLVKQIKEAV